MSAAAVSPNKYHAYKRVLRLWELVSWRVGQCSRCRDPLTSLVVCLLAPDSRAGITSVSAKAATHHINIQGMARGRRRVRVVSPQTFGAPHSVLCRRSQLLTLVHVCSYISQGLITYVPPPHGTSSSSSSNNTTLHAPADGTQLWVAASSPRMRTAFRLASSHERWVVRWRC